MSKRKVTITLEVDDRHLAAVAHRQGGEAKLARLASMVEASAQTLIDDVRDEYLDAIERGEVK